MLTDVFKAQSGQIWFIGEGQDKFNVREDDNKIQGKRPAIVLRSSGTNSLVIPFSTSKRYAIDDTEIRLFDNDIICYAAFDCAQTLSAFELNEYVGILKQSLLNKIQKTFIDYVTGKIYFSTIKGAYDYYTCKYNTEKVLPPKPNSKFIANYDLEQSDNDNIEHSYDSIITRRRVNCEANEQATSDISEEDKQRKYHRYTDDEKVFILTHLADDIQEKFDITRIAATKLKSRIAKELNCEPIGRYDYVAREQIVKLEPKEIVEQYNVNLVTAKYLKAEFLSRMRK